MGGGGRAGPSAGLRRRDPRVHRMTDGIDLEALDDRQALDLFSEVPGAMETSEADVFTNSTLEFRADTPRH